MSLLEGGIDMDKFLDTFLNDLFPELKDRPVHFAGESFGGKYVPVYTAMTRRKFESIILVDPYIDPALHALSMYEHFCPVKGDEREVQKDGRPPRYVNETACAAMESVYGKCDTFRKECESTYNADICFRGLDECEKVSKWVDREGRPGGRDPYDDRRTCGKPPLCNDMGMSAYKHNRARIG
jgi:carboxypeptidase C (cathepsin A)